MWLSIFILFLISQVMGVEVSNSTGSSVEVSNSTSMSIVASNSTHLSVEVSNSTHTSIEAPNSTQATNVSEVQTTALPVQFTPPAPMEWPDNDVFKDAAEKTNVYLMKLLEERSKEVQQRVADYSQKIMTHSLLLMIIPIFNTLLLITLICSFIHGMKRRKRITVPQMVHEIHEALMVKNPPGQTNEEKPKDDQKSAIKENKTKFDPTEMLTLRGMIETRYNLKTCVQDQQISRVSQTQGPPAFPPTPAPLAKDDTQSTDLAISFSTIERDRPHKKIKDAGKNSIVGATQESSRAKVSDMKNPTTMATDVKATQYNTVFGTQCKTVFGTQYKTMLGPG
ncbi:unnamed protein product [Bursaphelenchus xylophilus]|uniref:(pine wood nematode) hypothetical protein n=1 Tax=Bursaphelenchus xylophilus TaxID=6326 RepID=A0A1I7SLE3_BURXY|nr:unnamed protein product [Bursaphelenchus xylophilus]CAG9129530.1 unnamed protein product [Bursaphelenchus xylophilus]